VVTDSSADGKAPFLSIRMVEWGLVAMLIGTLVVVFVHQTRVVQRQAELAGVQANLGALRTAFVLSYMQRQSAAANQKVVPVQRNPFELLQNRPGNYWGEVRSNNLALVPLGSWVFDAVCDCIGYLPLDAAEFDSPSSDALAWYQVEGASGPLQLKAKQRYVLHGQVID